MDITFYRFSIVIAIVISLIAANTVCNHNGGEYYNNRIKNKKTTPKLYDLGHKYLPNMIEYSTVSDIATIMLILVPFLFAKTSKPIIEYLIYMSIILTIRAITINLTILPKDKSCREEHPTLMGGCYDKIFSGHSSSVLVATLVFYRYGIITNVPLLVIMNIVNNILILTTRGHYSVDIIVAIIISLAVYDNKVLHEMVDTIVIP